MELTRKFYNALDEKVGFLIQEARRRGKVKVIILSKHGFQKCQYNVNLNTWLLKKGYLRIKKNIQKELLALFRKSIKNIPFLKRIKRNPKLKGHFKEAVVSNIFFEKVKD